MSNDLFPYGRILFSSPGSAYDLKYRINPWMDPGHQSIDKRKAVRQWTGLINTVIRLGAYVEVVSVPHPDGVFSANAGLVHGTKFVLSTFAHAERRGEESHWLNWARTVKHPAEDRKFFDSIHVLNNEPFEGAGDALFAGDLLVCGHGFRSSLNATKQLEELLGVEVLPLELKSESFYHLDTCFCPLTDDLVMFHPQAFVDPDAVRRRFKCIEVSTQDAGRFACNAVVMGDNVILPSGCDHTMKQLSDAAFNCYPVEMGEYIKTGGACKCLTLKYC